MYVIVANLLAKAGGKTTLSLTCDFTIPSITV